MPAKNILGQWPLGLLKAFAYHLQVLGVRKIATSSNYPNSKGWVERVNHMMVQILAMVFNELQNK